MGDTGSLAARRFRGIQRVHDADADLYRRRWPDLPGGVLSVIIQVTYFKKTGGKRIFKMAPIHHHFELCGWSETRVVAVFSIVTAILCLVAYMGL